LVSHIEGQTQAEGIPEYGTEEIFGPKGDEVTGKWRRLHNEEIYNVFSS
jgi:hypothetical protein